MPTASTAKVTTPRKRRTRKASTTAKKSSPLNKTVAKQIVTEVIKEEVKVDVKRRNISELNGLELVILPLVYLEGFVKLILKETGVTA